MSATALRVVPVAIDDNCLIGLLAFVDAPAAEAVICTAMGDWIQEKFPILFLAVCESGHFPSCFQG